MKETDDTINQLRAQWAKHVRDQPAVPDYVVGRALTVIAEKAETRGQLGMSDFVFGFAASLVVSVVLTLPLARVAGPTMATDFADQLASDEITEVFGG